MEIDYPTTLNILGHHYSVERGNWEDLRDANSYGEMNNRTQTIRIMDNRPWSQQMETFIHEIIHIVSMNLLKDDLTEYQITLLSKGLNEALQGAGVRFKGSEHDGQDSA